MKKLSSFFNKTKASKGFTLIEILVVIGIIAILAAIVIIAINPAKQFAQARNTQRQAGVNTILNAIGQRMADNKGVFAGTFDIPAGTTYTCGTLPTGATGTAITATTRGSTTSGDLGCLVPTYVATIPTDPDPNFTLSDTGFTVTTDSTGRVTVCAPHGNEASIPGSGPICVTR